LNYKLVN